MRGPGSLVLSRIRQTVNAYLPGTAIILSRSNTVDETGAWSEGWTASSTVSCNVLPVQINTQMDAAGGGEAELMQYTLVVPYNTAITLENSVVYNGGTYEIRKMEHENNSYEAFHKYRIARVI
jgi:primosomal protein N'